MNQNFLWSLHVYGWRDCIEIALLSGGVYYLSHWLKKDFQKPLLLYFYGYCALFFITHYVHLQTLSSSLLFFAPVAMIVFIILHQNTLQKNFITLHNITPTAQMNEHWTELLMRSCLIAASNNKHVRCIIEKTNALTTCLETAVTLDCNLTEGLLDILIDSNSFNKNNMIWLQGNGTVKGINSSWKKSSVEAWLAQDVKEQEEWVQDALFFTTKTDALFFSIDPTSRTCTVVCQGKLAEHVSAHAALKSIKRYFNISLQNKKGELYDQQQKTTTHQQHTS